MVQTKQIAKLLGHEKYKDLQYCCYKSTNFCKVAKYFYSKCLDIFILGQQSAVITDPYFNIRWAMCLSDILVIHNRHLTSYTTNTYKGSYLNM